MCINCNIKLPVPNPFCDVLGLKQGALMSRREVSYYAMKFDYTTLSQKKKSQLFFLLKGRNVDEALKEFDDRAIERKNNTGKGGIFEMIGPDLWETHPIGAAVCREMEKSVPGLYYATVQHFKVVDKQQHQTLDGTSYITGKYELINKSSEPLQPIKDGNWEYFLTMYDI